MYLSTNTLPLMLLGTLAPLCLIQWQSDNKVVLYCCELPFPCLSGDHRPCTPTLLWGITSPIPLLLPLLPHHSQLGQISILLLLFLTLLHIQLLLPLMLLICLLLTPLPCCALFLHTLPLLLLLCFVPEVLTFFGSLCYSACIIKSLSSAHSSVVQGHVEFRVFWDFCWQWCQVG